VGLDGYVTDENNQRFPVWFAMQNGCIRNGFNDTHEDS
jgi:hypothetical protein